MSIQNNVELIQTILAEKQKHKFATRAEQFAWERGFLTGVLAKLANDDSFVRTALKQLLKKKQ
jgi:hypothetical protein